jgi:elongation factor G
MRVVIETGQSHPVDSSDIAFRLAAVGAFRQAFARAAPVVLEPQMLVEVCVPAEYQGTVMGDLNRRRGMILDASAEVDDAVLTAHVPLSEMFGYSSALRSATAGKGEYSMEFVRHAPVTAEAQAELTGHYKGARKG